MKYGVVKCLGHVKDLDLLNVTKVYLQNVQFCNHCNAEAILTPVQT